MLDAEADRHRASVRRTCIEVRLPSTAFSDVEATEFPTTHSLPIDDVLGLLATGSHDIVADEAERARLDRIARDVLAAQSPGQATVPLPLRSWCWRTRLIAPYKPWWLAERFPLRAQAEDAARATEVAD